MGPLSDGQAVALAVLLLGLNAFFVGAEFALISSRRTQIEPRAAAGSRAARVTLGAMERVSLMMAGAQLGITVCSLGLGAIGEPAVAHLIEPGLERLGLPEGFLHPVAFTIALTIVVALHVVVGEMVPKNIAIAGPERAAVVLAPALVVVVAVLKPFVVVLNAIANTVLRAIRVRPAEEVRSTYTSEEVAGLVEESHREGMLDVEEYERLAGALGFGHRRVAEVVIPPENVSTVPSDATRAEVEARCASTGFSRFPVTDGDRMIGYVHVKDVLRDDLGLDARLPGTAVRQLASVPADAALHDALRLMQAGSTHAAVVGGDAGQVLGVVMLEDVLAELVGEIRDARVGPG